MHVSKLKVMRICFFISLFAAQAALANVVGSVIFKTGDVSITHEDKSVISAEKNLALNAGDTIETREGRVQFSLIDGGKISLQPNSIFKISKYEFTGKEDGSEYAFMELIKGGLRTITGLIGHKNHERYQLKTTVATIGIRGTEFTVNFNNNLFLMTTNHGSVDVCSAGGNCLNAVTGQSIVVSGVGATPQFSKKPAVAAASPPDSTKVVFSSSDNIANGSISGVSGLPTIVANGLTNGTIVSMAVPNNILNVQTEILPAQIQTDSNGNVTNASSSKLNYNASPLSFTSYNSDGVVAWGQASSGAFSGNGTAFNMTKYDYIVGPTPNPASLASLSGTYSVTGYTTPFFVSSAGVVSAIGIAPTTGNFSFDFTTGPFNYTYSISVNTLYDTYNLSGSGTGFNANKADAFGLSGAVTSANGTCGNGCSGVLKGVGLGANNLVQGGFLGTNGERVGMQYGFTVPGGVVVPSAGGNIYGSAVLSPSVGF